MRIYSEHGRNDILFEFTEIKYKNKIKSFKRFAKEFTSKFFKRKAKVSGCYIDYTWGYKTKEPGISYSRILFPVDDPHTLSKILEFAITDLNVKYEEVQKKYDAGFNKQYNKVSKKIENSELSLKQKVKQLDEFVENYNEDTIFWLREIKLNFIYT
jgi:hypothetical protein